MYSRGNTEIKLLLVALPSYLFRSVGDIEIVSSISTLSTFSNANEQRR